MTRAEALETLYETVQAYDQGKNDKVRWIDVRRAIADVDSFPRSPKPVGDVVEIWGAVRADSKGMVDGRICHNKENAHYHANRAVTTENGQVLGTVFRLSVPLASTREIEGETGG